MSVSFLKKELNAQNFELHKKSQAMVYINYSKDQCLPIISLCC